MSNETTKNEDTIHAEIGAALALSGLRINGTLLQHDNGTSAHLAFEHDTTPGGRRKLRVEVSCTGDEHARWFTERKAGFELDLIVAWLRTAFDKTVAYRLEVSQRAEQLKASSQLCEELSDAFDDAPFELAPTEEGADKIAVAIPGPLLMTRAQLNALAHLLNASGNYTPTKDPLAFAKTAPLASTLDA